MRTLYLTITAAVTILASSLATAWAVVDTVTLKSSYADQRALPNLTDQPVDVDAEIDITLQPLEVIVLEGTNAPGK